MKKEVFIEVKNLSRKIKDQYLLKNISFQLFKGETLVILGPSGGGKSLLLRHIIGLETPTHGSVIIKNKKIELLGSSSESYENIKGVGMIFQHGALFDVSVLDNIQFYLKEHKLADEKTRIQIAKKCMRMVGLPQDSEKKLPPELSGGMIKRVAYARVLAYSPDIILYDEFTSELDPYSSQQMNILIKKMQKETMITNLIVTHDVRAAKLLADRVMFLYEGSIMHIGDKKTFFNTKEKILKEFISSALD